MALPRDYDGQACSLARTLEVVGERWTLLILRDAFYGVRRFGDLVAHLGIPRAVLTDRLKSLSRTDILTRVARNERNVEYELTQKGLSLWPVIRVLVAWGDDHYAPTGPRRIFCHADDGAPLDPTGHCTGCNAMVSVSDTLVAPGPGLAEPTERDDPITAALRQPHRLLTPLRSETSFNRIAH
jgi:DNA-binding HxlR family transcriptional regulator